MVSTLRMLVALVVEAQAQAQAQAQVLALAQALVPVEVEVASVSIYSNRMEIYFPSMMVCFTILAAISLKTQTFVVGIFTTYLYLVRPLPKHAVHVVEVVFHLALTLALAQALALALDLDLALVVALVAASV